MKITRIKSTVLCVAAVLFGMLLAALRMSILFGSFDPAIDLYPKGSARDTLESVLFFGSLVLLLGGALFVSKENRYKLNFSGVTMTFSHSFLGLCFLGLAIATFIRAKIGEVSLSRLDSVLIVLSLVSAASFFMEAFGTDAGLGHDATTVMMLSRPITCLFISFYFYFDTTSVIHSSNKRLATLFYALVLLTLLYAVKFRTQKPRVFVFMSFAALSVSYGIMYCIPNVVWFVLRGDELVLNIFFDLLALALTVWCLVCVLSVRTLELVSREEILANIVSDKHTDCKSDADLGIRSLSENGGFCPSRLLDSDEYASMISEQISVQSLSCKSEGGTFDICSVTTRTENDK